MDKLNPKDHASLDFAPNTSLVQGVRPTPNLRCIS
jgi:hypothetical protein